MDIEIQTYWNVETLYYVFNAVAAMMTSAGFSGLLKLVFLFAIAIGMFGFMNKQLEMAKWFIQALAFVTVLNLPIAKVMLTDKSGLEPPRVVDHVPFALAVIGQTTNLVFGALTNTYETAFGIPEDLGLQKGDVGFGHRILKSVNNATIRDPGLRADLMQFIKECTLYDVKDGVITPQQLVGGIDTWQVIFNNTNPARFVTFNTLTSKPTTETCTQAANVLKTRVNDAVTAAQTFYGKQAFTRANSDAVASSLFVSAVGTSYDWILNSASNASDAMKQAMFNNIWKEAGSELPVLLNDPARVTEVNGLAAAAQAARQADGSNSTLSLLAQETLPHMRNWIEAILYGLFPVVVVLMVLSSTESAKKIIAGYCMSLCWIGLWPILFAIINHLSLMHLRYKARALELAAGVPFQLTDAFDATLTNEQAAIGYMVVLVPFIAGAVIRLGQGGFLSVADRMMAGFASAGGTAGSNMASGNARMGQTGLDSSTVNTTTMHKYDGVASLTAGGAVINRGDGSTMTMARDGNAVFQQFQNQMLSQMDMDHRQDSGLNQEAHRTGITSSGNQLSIRSSEASTFTDVQGHDDTRGYYQQSGAQVSSTNQGSYSGTHATGQTLADTFRENSGFNMRAGANQNLGMNLGARIGAGVGIPGGSYPVSRNGAPDPREEQRMLAAMQQQGATPQQIQQAQKNYRSSSGKNALSGGGFVNAGVGFDARKTYDAAHLRNRETTTQHGLDESARLEHRFSESGAHTQQDASGQQANQINRHGRDAATSQIDESSHIRDVSDRQEFGTGDRAHRSESHSFTIRRNLMADPYFIANVATRNGMNPVRFFNQPEDRRMEMILEYVSEKEMVQKATRMPQQTFEGEQLPTTPRALEKLSTAQRNALPQHIAGTHQKKISETGYTDAGPLNVDTSVPKIIDSAHSNVRAQLDPQKKDSIPARAAALDENVNAWASPDKAVGEGRMDPMAVTTTMGERDIKDTVSKMWDKVTGGDGTADSKKLTDNQRRETGVDLKGKKEEEK